ncbi:MAG TPA: hypothetical protein VGU63_13200 [Candidatus Acidoferrales bacterium]|nr:hypothetical protein [Candidatus Acidoferrales bacterium]
MIQKGFDTRKVGSKCLEIRKGSSGTLAQDFLNHRFISSESTLHLLELPVVDRQEIVNG